LKRDIPQLHFIRSLAMAGIFVHHLYMGLGPLRQSQAGTWLDGAFVDLALGVVLFNIMTSFLLAMPYVGDNPAPVPRLRDFLPKRLKRLCPLYYLCVILVIAGNALVYRVTAPSDWLPPALYHLLFLDPLRLASFMSNTAAYWWLGLLFQFTLAYPLILRLFRRFGPARTTIVAALVAWPATEALKAWGRADPDGLGGAVAFLSTFNLPSRLPEFFIGMWLAKLWKDNPDRTWLAGKPLNLLVFGACAACLIWPALTGQPAPWFTGLAFSLVVFLILYALPVSSWLGRKSLVLWFSGASYAVYLAHQPILSYLDPALAGLAPWNRFLAMLVLAGTASLIAALALDKASAAITSRI
jgi:peptidoglycan/LPS O-acetylase OafA/YrhL